MKKKYIFSFGLLLLTIPFLALALKMQIDPITPCITSVPCFIKSFLDIVFKLGIAAASFFLIWAGFLFLKAQGDPSALTTAKRAFTWAVIGTAVVFGSWMLSTVIKVTIWERIGSNVSLESFDICACATTPQPPPQSPPINTPTCASAGKQCLPFNQCSILTIVTPTPADCTGGTSCCDPGILYAIPTIPPHYTQEEHVPVICTGGGDTSGGYMKKTFFQYWSYSSLLSGDPFPTTDVNYGGVGNNTEDCLYEQGVYMTKIQANRVPTEQGWFYVLDGNGNNQWKSVGNGTTAYLETPISNFKILQSTTAYSIIYFHTHPQTGLKNDKGQTLPSSGDILMAAMRNAELGQSVLHRVSDSAIDLSRPDAPYTVWAYTASNASPFISATKTGIDGGWHTFVDGVTGMANNQKDPNAIRFMEDFKNKYSLRDRVQTTEQWIDAVWTSLVAAEGGTYGAPIANMAKEYVQKIANTPLYSWWDTYRNCVGGEDTTNKMLEIYRNNGVTVTEEQHPYQSCV